MKEYDLVVVGSGAALSVLEAALELGLSCALVERSLFGGTCLTRGCIPSKVLVHPADVIREAQHARRIGLDLRVERIDWATLTRRMRHQIDGNQMIERDIGDVDGLDVYKGTAEFTGADTMLVRYADGTASEAFRGAKFLLAGGGRPFIPPIEGLAETGYLDSESFFGDQFPSAPWNRLVIIGGGAIGAEFAHIFSAFGTHVTIVEQLPELIMTEEPEIRELLTESFRHNGIDVLTDFRALRAFREAGQKVLEVENRSTGQVSTLRCDEILVSAGLRSNADLLHLERTTIRTDVNGWIFTDASLETTQPNVWAIGDINGKYQFRHKANYEAGICAQNMLGSGEGRALADYSSVPWAIFTWPQIAHVGMTESQVQASGVRYLIGQRHYSSVAQGFAMGYEHGDVDDGFFKLIADDQYRILGAHIIGPQASVLIQSIVYLMNSGATCQIEKTGRLLKRSRQVCDAGGSFMPLNDSMVIHPALSEVVGWITGNLYWAGPHGEHTHEHDHDHGGHDHDHGGHDHDHGGHDHDHGGHDHDHRGHVHDPEAGDEPT